MRNGAPAQSESKAALFPAAGDVWGLGPRLYGDTVIVAVLLVTLPMDALMCTAPAVVFPATIVTRPADTVARLVLSEFQVAIELMFGLVPPPQRVADAVIGKVGLLVVIVPLVGFSVIV